MISSKKPDDDVGTGRQLDSFRQTPEQASALGRADEDPQGGGLPEPKSAEDWAARGASGGVPGRPPVAIGGNSQGQGDRMPAGGGTVSDEPSSNPKYVPGERHES